MTAATWWSAGLERFRPRPAGLRPGAETCWCCLREGVEYKPGWLECTAHPEGPVRWYGGMRPLVTSNGVRRLL